MTDIEKEMNRFMEEEFEFLLRNNKNNQKEEQIEKDIDKKLLEELAAVEKEIDELLQPVKEPEYELMISFGDNWLYYKTKENNIKEAYEEFMEVCKKAGIILDNMEATEIELRKID